jgi:hypothetical protein
MGTTFKVILSLVFTVLSFHVGLAQDTKKPYNKVYVFDELKNESIDKAIGSSQVSSKRHGGILIALVFTEDPNFMKMVKDAMNDNIAAGRKKIMIVEGNGEGQKSSWVSLYANGKLGDSYYFDKDNLKSDSKKLFLSTKRLYEKEIENLN